MKICQVIPSGYCKGVIRAILAVKETIKKYPDKKIYILGMIVHNDYVVKALENEGVITLTGDDKFQLIDSIDDGVLIFTAHGISEQIKQYAINKGLTIVDATCLDVVKNTALIKQYLTKKYHVIYIGKCNHPESLAVLSLSNEITLVSNLQQIANLNIDNKNILVTNQTTMSIFEIDKMMQEIKNKYPNCVIAKEICNATTQRQAAIINLKNVDCLVIVGDPNSNNTAQLYNIAKEKGIKKVIKVECASQINKKDFQDVENIAITAGASTPTYLTKQVINYLETFDNKYLEIDLNSILRM